MAKRTQPRSMHSPLVREMRQYLDLCCLQLHHNTLTNPNGPHVYAHHVIEQALPNSLGYAKEMHLALALYIKLNDNSHWNVRGGYRVDPSLRADAFVNQTILETLTERGDSLMIKDGAWQINSNGQVMAQHWWLEQDGHLLDIAADGFGEDRVVHTIATNPNYCVDPRLSLPSVLKPAWKTMQSMCQGTLSVAPGAVDFSSPLAELHQGLVNTYPSLAKGLAHQDQKEATLTPTVQ